MEETLTPDLCVIGAGSGGLTVAAAAAQLGASVVLIEKGRMGGECLNAGCVPSKALIAAANRAHAMRTSAEFGIQPVEPQINYTSVHDHVHEVIAAIEPNDSVERFTGLGVTVINAEASFKDRETVIARGIEIKARYFVIATGSSPFIPPVPGLKDVPHYTNETIFHNQTRPNHLLVIGAGPVGLELAQAHRRLGAQVTVLDMAPPLARADGELTRIVLGQLRDEGIRIESPVEITGLGYDGTQIEAGFIHSGSSQSDVLQVSHLLVATGRVPNIDGLALDKARIRFDRSGIKVSRGMKTSNSRVFAIGDVAEGPNFTHMASHQAGIVIRRALFKTRAKAQLEALPTVIFTAPELASVGMTEAEAKKKYRTIRIHRCPLAENDRAQAEHETRGLAKIITTKKGRVLGASIAAPHAGEMIQIWTLAIATGQNIRTIADLTFPYPTWSEISKRAAQKFYLPKLASPMVKRLLGLLKKLG